MGGQGKTQSALNYCRQAFQDGTFDTILWIDATSVARAQHAIESIVPKANFSTSSGAPKTPEANLSTFKDTLASRSKPCLLLYNYYDSPKEFMSIGNMFPKGARISILITSHHSASLPLGTPIYVVDMEPAEVEDLLLISSGLIRQESESETLRSIVERLGCLPLALDQAGAYIRARHLPLDTFEKHYIERREQILKYTPELFDYRKKLPSEAEESVLSAFTTWEISLEQLGKDRPHIEQLLTLGASLYHKHIFEGLFKARCSPGFETLEDIPNDWIQCMLTIPYGTLSLSRHSRRTQWSLAGARLPHRE